MKRDLSQAQFEEKARKLGFKKAIGGFLEYWECPSGVHVSVLNAGRRRRDQLRYLINQDKKNAARKTLDAQG